MDTSFLPIDFINRMEQDLGPDFHAFLRSYEKSKISALQFNPIKADDKEIENIKDMSRSTSLSPWRDILYSGCIGSASSRDACAKARGFLS